jgi:hypothetical protein
MDTLSYEYGRQLSHDHPTEIWVVPLAATSGPKASSASEEACAVPSTATDNCVKSSARSPRQRASYVQVSLASDPGLLQSIALRQSRVSSLSTL